MSKRTVLVVDDAPGIIYLLQVVLEHAGYRVVGAAGADAVQLACDLGPDVILPDVLMPGVDGVEVGRRLRADPRTAHIPVVAVSALHDLTLKMQAVQMHADDYLSKPFDVGDVVNRVQKWAGDAPVAPVPANAGAVRA